MRLVHSSFPRELPAAGLLVLRIAFGVVAQIQGWRLVSAPAEGLGPDQLFGGAAMVLGVAIQVGVLTSIAAGLLAIGTVVAAKGGLGGLGSGDAPLPALGLISVCVVIALTGPGAYSLDAVLFGPREVVLRPPSTPFDPQSDDPAPVRENKTRSSSVMKGDSP